MGSYRKNKLGTAWEITRKIENWPTAWGLRLFRKRAGLRLLKLRNGLQLVCRGNSRDWDVFHELFFAGGYESALRYLANQSGAPKVLDLGGNIGLFALLAARSHPLPNIFSYEPGPPNARLFEVNRLLNPELMDRIALSQSAAGAQDRVAEWYFDEKNPGGSGFFAGGNHRFPVTVHAFDRIVESFANPLDLVKMDIEGAEYEIFFKSSLQTWQKIQAMALELHEDPQGLIPRERCLEAIRRLGFQVKEESVISLFLHR